MLNEFFSKGNLMELIFGLAALTSIIAGSLQIYDWMKSRRKK